MRSTSLCAALESVGNTRAIRASTCTPGERGPGPGTAVVGRRLHERSHLYNRVLDWIAPAAAAAPDGSPAGEWVTRRHEALRDEAAARELGLRLVARMRALAEATGAGFVVALHPDKKAFKHGSEWIDAFYADPDLSGVTVVDLGREYRSAGLRGAELMLDGLGHLSPFGHQQAAARLRAPLERAAGTPRDGTPRN